MRHLLLVTFIMGLLVVSVLRSTGPDEVLVQQIRNMADGDELAPVVAGTVHPNASIAGVEKMMTEVPFSEAEQERLDQLSQKFPASLNAFHKLCALERLRAQLTDAEYLAVANKYLAQLQSNRKDADALLKSIMSSTEQDEATVSFKQLGYLTAGKLELASARFAAKAAGQANGQKLGGALNAAMITTTMRAEMVKKVAPVADADRPKDLDTD